VVRVDFSVKGQGTPAPIDAPINLVVNGLYLYEEPHLRKIFGEQYLDYCRRVPRWIPPNSPRAMTLFAGFAKLMHNAF
jgi:hypothetical protein